MRLTTIGGIATPPIKVDTLIFDYSNWSISVIFRSRNISKCEKITSSRTSGPNLTLESTFKNDRLEMMILNIRIKNTQIIPVRKELELVEWEYQLQMTAVG